jgi:plastocyanin
MKGDVRANLVRLQAKLDAAVDRFEPLPDGVSLGRIFEAVIATSGKILHIAVTDRAPGFAPAELIVGADDSVAFRYEPASDGHSVSHELHQIEIGAAKVHSPLLRAGESFTYRFTEPGQYVVSDAKHPGAMAVVRVVAK